MMNTAKPAAMTITPVATEARGRLKASKRHPAKPRTESARGQSRCFALKVQAETLVMA